MPASAILWCLSEEFPEGVPPIPDEAPPGAEGGPFRPRISLSNLRGARRALREVAQVGRIYRGLRAQHKKEDPETPFRVHADERTLRIAARAAELAEEGREDPAAAEELRQLAGGERAALVRVEEFCRLDGHHLEDRLGNHAHRLVSAALSRKSLAPIDPADSERIELLAAALPPSLSDDEAWAELVSREPGLIELESKVCAGSFGFADDRLTVGPFLPDDPQEREQLAEEVARSRRLIQELKGLVGPPSKSHDPVLRSRLAFARAASHLQELKPPAPE